MGLNSDKEICMCVLMKRVCLVEKWNGRRSINYGKKERNEMGLNSNIGSEGSFTGFQNLLFKTHLTKHKIFERDSTNHKIFDRDSTILMSQQPLLPVVAVVIIIFFFLSYMPHIYAIQTDKIIFIHLEEFCGKKWKKKSPQYQFCSYEILQLECPGFLSTANFEL